MDLETSRLVLREIRDTDIADIHFLISNAKVAEFNTLGIPEDTTISKTIVQGILDDQRKDSRTKYGWIIRLKANDQFIGEIGLDLGIPRYKIAEIHYSLLPSFWGNGYAIEAAKRVLAFGFDTLHLHRIEAGVATQNVKSVKLLERLGMTREGRKRKVLPIRGGWMDNFHYAILEADERFY